MKDSMVASANVIRGMVGLVLSVRRGLIEFLMFYISVRIVGGEIF